MSSGWPCSYDDRLTGNLGYQRLLDGPDASILQYSTRHAMPDMFGHHLSDLWTLVVPQKCHSEPLVRQAVVALGSIHLDYATATRLDADGTLAVPSTRSVELYVKALGMLHEYIIAKTRPSKAGVLFSCAALLGFNLIRGNRDEAVRHLDSGAAIIRAWSAQRAQSQRLCRLDDFDKLYDLFSAFDVQATAYDEDRIPALGRLHVQRCSSIMIPAASIHASQAQQILMRLINCAFTDLVDNAVYKDCSREHVPISVINRRQSLCHAFGQWSLAVARYEDIRHQTLGNARPDKHQRDFTRDLQMMRLQHRTMQLLLNEDRWALDLGLSFDTHAMELLGLAEGVLSQGSNSASGLNRSFGLDLGVGPPLFLLALKTSKAHIRSRARRLIGSVHRMEGWYSPSFMCEAIDQLLLQQNRLESELHASNRGGSDALTIRLEEVAEMNILSNVSGSTGMRRILA